MCQRFPAWWPGLVEMLDLSGAAESRLPGVSQGIGRGSQVGEDGSQVSKYHADRKNADGTKHGYASRKEARVAGELAILAKAGRILDLREQVPFELVKGRNGIQ